MRRRRWHVSPSAAAGSLTNADRIPSWFLPVSGDLRVGGRYQLQGNANGVIERCTEPESFAVTWEFGGALSWLAVTLTPDGERTTLELAHQTPVDPERWARYGPSAVGIGWDLALIGLGQHLDRGAAVDPREAAAFLASPDGVEFVRIAATGWAAAVTSLPRRGRPRRERWPSTRSRLRPLPAVR